MGESTTGALTPLDTFIKYAAPLLGLATAGLTLFIALSTRETNERLATTKAELEKLNLVSAQYDLAARVIGEFGVQNAREYASTVEQKKTAVDVPDADLRRQLADGVLSWQQGKQLMTGFAATGLYLRQIVYLKLTSLGKTAATDLRLVVRLKDFGESVNGTQDRRYGAIDIRGAGWEERTLPLTALMELSADTRAMRTQVLIPLAEVSGGEYYFGRVLVPVRLLWKDARLDKERELDLDVSHESALDNQLQSAILGRSVSKAR